jgi:hypothetical protein
MRGTVLRWIAGSLLIAAAAAQWGCASDSTGYAATGAWYGSYGSYGWDPWWGAPFCGTNFHGSAFCGGPHDHCDHGRSEGHASFASASAGHAASAAGGGHGR